MELRRPVGKRNKTHGAECSATKKKNGPFEHGSAQDKKGKGDLQIAFVVEGKGVSAQEKKPG